MSVKCYEAEYPLTVGQLMKILAALPSDAPIWIQGDGGPVILAEEVGVYNLESNHPEVVIN